MELETLPVYIIGGRNLNIIRHANDTVLMADTEGKLRTLLDEVVKGNKKKGRIINSKKTKNDYQQENKTKMRTQIGNVNI